MVSEASAASAHWRAHATDETSWDVSIGAVLGLAVVFMAGLAFYFAITEGQGRLHPDMSEAYAWGREFQIRLSSAPAVLGLALRLVVPDLAARILGVRPAERGQPAAGMLGAWAAIGEFARGPKRVAATALLLLTPCYSILAFKYNANIIFISLWPLTIYALMRALENEGAGRFGHFRPLHRPDADIKVFRRRSAAFLRFGGLAGPSSARLFQFRLALISPGLVAGAIFAPHMVWLLTHQARQSSISRANRATAERDGRFRRSDASGRRDYATPANGSHRSVFESSAPSVWLDNARLRWREPLIWRPRCVDARAGVLSLSCSRWLLRTRIYSEMIVGVLPLAPCC